jgi:hypothetical protein
MANKKHKRTIYTWIILVLILINLLSGLVNIGISYYTLGLKNPLFTISLIHIIITIVLGIIFLKRLFYLEKEVFLMLKIFFIYIAIVNPLIACFVFYLNNFNFSDINLLYSLIYEIIRFIVVLIIGISFYKHLENSKKKKTMEFK